MEDCHVVLWRFSDGSGCGAVRVFVELEDAQKMIDFLADHGDVSKNFFIDTVKLSEQ